MSTARREAMPVKSFGVKLNNRRVIGGLMADGSILWQFRRLTPERAIACEKIRLSKEAVEAMFAIMARLDAQNAPAHRPPVGGTVTPDDGVDDTDGSLRCDRCGAIETPPYDDGDACVCGGTFHHEPGGTRKAKTQHAERDGDTTREGE